MVPILIVVRVGLGLAHDGSATTGNGTGLMTTFRAAPNEKNQSHTLEETTTVRAKTVNEGRSWLTSSNDVHIAKSDGIV